jgi:hypothetical protein
VHAGVLTLPPAQFALSADGLTASSAGTVSYSLCEPEGCTTATAFASDTPAVSISGAGGIGAGASSGLYYAVAVLGGGGLVKVDFTTSGAASGGTASQAAASVGGFGGVACSGSNACGDTPSSFSISGSFMAQACDLAVGNCGSSFGVTIGVTADTSGDDGAFSASADPYIYIDPAFLAANPEYYVVVSAGIDNAPLPAVPEVSTWALMALGFAGLGLAGWRRRAERLRVLG